MFSHNSSPSSAHISPDHRPQNGKVMQRLSAVTSLLDKLRKVGNSHEVRKLLGRGVQITKDKVKLDIILPPPH